jgi:hypothetical protein
VGRRVGQEDGGKGRPARQLPGRSSSPGAAVPGCCLPGSFTVMVGMRLWCAYSSLRRLTRSIHMPRTCRQLGRQVRRQTAGTGIMSSE